MQVPPVPLQEAIACAKIHCAETAIELCFRLKQEAPRSAGPRSGARPRFNSNSVVQGSPLGLELGVSTS